MNENTNPRWSPPLFRISNKGYFTPPVTLIWLHLSADQIWCRSVKKWLRYTSLCISKLAPVRHLGFVPKFWTNHEIPSKGCYADLLTHGPTLSPRFRSYFCDFVLLCYFSCKSIKKWDRESADRQTDRCTDARENGFITCPMLCYSYGRNNKPTNHGLIKKQLWVQHFLTFVVDKLLSRQKN